MPTMGLSLNHRGWVLKMGGTRLGALQTGAVWHKRWVVIENGTLEYITEEVKRREEGDRQVGERLPLAGLEIHLPALPSKMILGKHAQGAVLARPPAAPPSRLSSARRRAA